MALADTVGPAREHLVDPTIFVLSKSYADAWQGICGVSLAVTMSSCLAGPMLSHGISAWPRTADCARSLGGTATSLNLRTAIAWLERTSAPTVSGNRDHATWKTWAAENSKPDQIRPPTPD